MEYDMDYYFRVPRSRRGRAPLLFCCSDHFYFLTGNTTGNEDSEKHIDVVLTIILSSENSSPSCQFLDGWYCIRLLRRIPPDTRYVSVSFLAQSCTILLNLLFSCVWSPECPNLPSLPFLGATKHLYKRVHPSVCPSVRPSVCLSVRPSVCPSVCLW